MEHWRMGLVVIIAIHAAWRDNTQWRLFLFHGTNLYARRLRPQHSFRREIKGVVIGTCRMIRWNIQRIKVMKIIFYFWAFNGAKTQVTKKRFYTLNGFSYRMKASHLRFASWQAHINTLSSEFLSQLSLF